jgi:hypothetical protein
MEWTWWAKLFDLGCFAALHRKGAGCFMTGHGLKIFRGRGEGRESLSAPISRVSSPVLVLPGLKTRQGEMEDPAQDKERFQFCFSVNSRINIE